VQWLYLQNGQALGNGNSNQRDNHLILPLLLLLLIHLPHKFQLTSLAEVLLFFRSRIPPAHVYEL
jgi:hypothetical protein